MKRFSLTIILVITCFFSCKEPYSPRVVTRNHFLVVEGHINAAENPTIIRLTRTRNLTDTGSITNVSGTTDTLFELHAQVRVEDSAGNRFPLPELEKGQYGGIPLSLNPEQKYRLYIRTASGKEYVSTYRRVIPAPEIDSLYWRLEDDGVHIYVDAHKERSAPPYYRLTYSSTWEFHSWFHSELAYNPEDSTMVKRPSREFLDTCWQTAVPDHILISSTEKRSQKQLTHAPVSFIPAHSERLSVLYTMQVKVYGMSREEYEFWQLMKKNTEELGTIFDPQPSMIRGNMKCLTRPSEPVIGYVGPGGLAKKRIWISNKQLPAGWNTNFFDCTIRELKKTGMTEQEFKALLEKNFGSPHPVLTPVSAVKTPGGNVTAYEIARRRCADCTQRGTRSKPYFWP